MYDAVVKLIAYILSDGHTSGSIVSVTSELESVADDLVDIAKWLNTSLTIRSKVGNRAKAFYFVTSPEHRQACRSTVAETLRRVCDAMGVSRAGWALAAGINSGILKAWMSGKCAPSQNELQALAAAACVHVEVLCPDQVRVASSKNQLAEILKSVGIWGKLAADKSIPQCIFRLPKEQLALFLRVLFTCDGSVYLKARGKIPMLSYSTISRRLAEDVHHLLLRFGIVARIRTKRMPKVRLDYIAYELVVAGVAPLQRFIAEIGVMKNGAAVEKILSMPIPTLASTHRDTIPTGAAFRARLKEYLNGEGVLNVYRRTGRRLHPGRTDRPLTRGFVQTLAKHYPSDELLRLANGDVYWDYVADVTPAAGTVEYGVGPTFQNCVIGDLIVGTPPRSVPQRCDQTPHVAESSGDCSLML